MSVLVVSAAAIAGDRELVPFEIVDGGIPDPLTDLAGDPVIGKQVVTNAANATCLICHPMPIPEHPDHGNLAPPLNGVGSRYSAAELRLRIVDAKVLNPDTIMPSYYRLSGFTRVSEEHLGQTVYSAQDVEDAIAYLMTLTDG
ncbi:MAG: sulfur oxidation c-type cytochrome SoxX [Proteobacteria bacterium]|nr:sulfur oxidation c-type cytochrome SoxX [Pseudomonadota bacterium]